MDRHFPRPGASSVARPPPEANLPQDFQILDSDDQLRLLKRIIKALNVDEAVAAASGDVVHQRQERRGPAATARRDLQQSGRGHRLRIYQAYQEACDRAGLVDFAELLLRAHELWLNKPHILNHYRERFTNVLVDEFRIPTASSTPDPSAGGRQQQRDDRR